MPVFNEDTRVKIPATIQLLRLGLAAKYGLSLLLLILSLKTTRNPSYLLWGALELAVIFLFSNFLISKHKAFNVLQALLLLLYNAEVLVLLFGGGFVSLVMLQSIRSLQDLGGKAFIYGFGVVFVLAVSVFPTHPVKKKPLPLAGLIALPVWVVCFVIWTFGFPGAGGVHVAYTPSAGIYELCRQYSGYREMQKMMEAFAAGSVEESPVEEESVQVEEDGGKIEHEEPLQEKEDTEGNVDAESAQTEEDSGKTEEQAPEPKVLTLEEQVAALTDYSGSVLETAHISIPLGTNVILIFVEGMSRNILTDSRNIMPNVAAFESMCISFKNYYHHSFATYRELQGQLFSGYNYSDLDSNSLISLEDIFRKNGYITTFINPEPYDADFTAYLNDLHFDTVVNGQNENFFLTDAQSYQLLYDTAEQYHNQGNPFFLSIYTFQTHASWDSRDGDPVFGDGTQRVLNRFYNTDYRFGQFFQKFQNSAMKDDTMIIFTSDHSTYADEDFISAFPDYGRTCTVMDTIPFMIYYRGNAMSVDAKGRNSLDMAPTLLELLGLDAPDTFLGNSLFNSKLDDKMDCYYWDPDRILYTGNNRIESVNDSTREKVMARLAQYFALKLR